MVLFHSFISDTNCGFTSTHYWQQHYKMPRFALALPDSIPEGHQKRNIRPVLSLGCGITVPSLQNPYSASYLIHKNSWLTNFEGLFFVIFVNRLNHNGI
jgi:hypothetical protein